jgi:hypothetical protein
MVKKTSCSAAGRLVFSITKIRNIPPRIHAGSFFDKNTVIKKKEKAIKKNKKHCK